MFKLVLNPNAGASQRSKNLQIQLLIKKIYFFNICGIYFELLHKNEFVTIWHSCILYRIEPDRPISARFVYGKHFLTTIYMLDIIITIKFKFVSYFPLSKIIGDIFEKRITHFLTCKNWKHLQKVYNLVYNLQKEEAGFLICLLIDFVGPQSSDSRTTNKRYTWSNLFIYVCQVYFCTKSMLFKNSVINQMHLVYFSRLAP